jgi:hypothetical protein
MSSIDKPNIAPSEWFATTMPAPSSTIMTPQSRLLMSGSMTGRPFDHTPPNPVDVGVADMVSGTPFRQIAADD